MASGFFCAKGVTKQTCPYRRKKTVHNEDMAIWIGSGKIVARQPGDDGTEKDDSYGRLPAIMALKSKSILN
jgi:hypothetical protein